MQNISSSRLGTKLSELQQQYVLGIDGGGTKCKAVLVDAGLNVLGSAVSGPANPYTNLNNTIESIVEASQLAIQDSAISGLTIDQLTVGMGLAGVNNETSRSAILKWQNPFSGLKLFTDLHAALYGAHLSVDGAIIITGTGSSGIACVGAETYIHGGHGFPQADNGSGAWIGRTVIEKVLSSLDGLSSKTLLTELVLNQLNGEIEHQAADHIMEYLRNSTARVFAQFALAAFSAAEAGDIVAKQIIQHAADYVSRLARKLLAYQPPRLCIVGGLSERLTPWLDCDVQQLLAQPKATAEIGAAWYAIRSKQKTTI